MSNANQMPGSSFEQRVRTESSIATYSCAITAFTPGTNATLICSLTQPYLPGTPFKRLALANVRVSGQATATSNLDVQLYKSTVPPIGGTSAAQAVCQHDSGDPAPTGTVLLYSTNPTTFVGQKALRAVHLQLAAIGTQAAPIQEINWDFGDRSSRCPSAYASGESFSLVLAGGAVPAGTVLTISWEWTEE